MDFLCVRCELCRDPLRVAGWTPTTTYHLRYNYLSVSNKRFVWISESKKKMIAAKYILYLSVREGVFVLLVCNFCEWHENIAI